MYLQDVEIKKMGGSATYGFILYYDLMSAVTAKQYMDGHNLKGNSIRVSISSSGGVVCSCKFYLALLLALLGRKVLMNVTVCLCRLDLVKEQLASSYGLMVLTLQWQNPS